MQQFFITAVPNPSGSGVSIEISSPHSGSIELFVYDLAGKLVSRITEITGSSYLWDCRDSSGLEVPSGTYIIRAVYEDRSASARFVKL